MDEESQVLSLDWPKWNWHFNLSLTIVSVALGLVVFFVPELTSDENKNLQIWRMIIGFTLLFFPLIVPLILWCRDTIKISLHRIYDYPKLHQRAKKDNVELIDLKKFIIDYIKREKNARSFEITAAKYDGNRFYIVVEKRKNPVLTIGSILTVVHDDDNKLMGVFKITEERNSEYYALGKSNIDPVWKSYVLERGESHVIPNMVALYSLSENDYE